MNRWLIVLLLAAAWTASAVLIFRLWSRNGGLADKIGGTVLLLVPFVGPLLYWFVYNSVPPQMPYLQNRGPRGTFNDKWMADRPFWDRVLKDRREKNKRKEQEDSPE